MVDARRRLEEVRARGPMVDELTADLRSARIRNNFAPMIERALRPR